MFARSRHRYAGLLLLLVLPLAVCADDEIASDKAKTEAKLPEIVDEPKTIDPGTLLPAKLTAKATVDFSDSSLSEVVRWLREEQNLVVLLEHNALDNVGVLPGDPISDRLDDAPVYFLLNRLNSLGLAWYFQDEILHVTSMEEAENRLVTLPYNIGDLIDAGYALDNLHTVVEQVAPEHWESVGGTGALNFIGDVMFVRQNGAVQRQVQGLLAALRGHARRTFTYDPPQHALLREGLQRNVSVAFADMPLKAAVASLAETAAIDIRLDLVALRDVGIREREPVTLELTERRLDTVLRAMLLDLDLTWVLRDGVLWITTPEEADMFLKTALYDVRDLCRDWDESSALTDAITSQTDATVWEDVGGPCSIYFAKPGTMVVRAQETTHDSVLELLETYRTALRQSKPRQQETDDPNEVTTVYYRLHANVAEGLQMLLPRLVKPGTWKEGGAPSDHPGSILLAPSPPEVYSDAGQLEDGGSEGAPGYGPTIVIQRAVLIITQTRAAHEEIAEVVRRVEAGDHPDGDFFMEDMSPGMGGMGGFGGGFLSVPPRRSKPPGDKIRIPR